MKKYLAHLVLSTFVLSSLLSSSPASALPSIRPDYDPVAVPAVKIIDVHAFSRGANKAERPIDRYLEAQEIKRQARLKAERKAERKEARRIANLPMVTEGILGPLSLPKGQPVSINLSLAAANIPSRTAPAGWQKSMHMLVNTQADFISLNEISIRANENIQSLAPAYGLVRGQLDASPGGFGQSLNNAILYKNDLWTPLASGMVKVVNDDKGFMQHKPFLWDRYAVWAILQHQDGSIVSVISTHMPTNPGKYPKQHGVNALSRMALYAKGMDTILEMKAQLENYGPVLLAGDMNSHPNQGPWTAPAKMATAGYGYTKDAGVMYTFFANAMAVVASNQLQVVSDHPALYTVLAPNAVGPVFNQ